LIEYRLSLAFQAKLLVIFEINKFSGYVLFIVALTTYHASVAQDIEGAKLALVSLSLSSYLRENVTVCVIKARNIFKLMQNGYDLLVPTGSLLSRKFKK